MILTALKKKGKVFEMERKSMFLALVLALILPGVGLVYVGQIGWGVFFIVIAGFSLLLIMTGLLIIIGVPLAIFSAIASVFATFFAAKAYNRRLA
jgi:TM2 domain-containing membrane protein YozV